MKYRAWDQLLRIGICLMRAMGQGAIIHIASVSARHGNLSRSADGAFKGGVITLSRLKYRAPERPWLAGRGRA